MDFMKIKERIFNELKKNRLFQSELVRYLKMSDTGYRQMFENRTLKLDTLYKISQYLDMPLCYFLDPDDTALFKPQKNDHEARIAALEKQIRDNLTLKV